MSKITAFGATMSHSWLIELYNALKSRSSKYMMSSQDPFPIPLLVLVQLILIQICKPFHPSLSNFILLDSVLKCSISVVLLFILLNISHFILIWLRDTHWTACQHVWHLCLGGQTALILISFQNSRMDNLGDILIGVLITEQSYLCKEKKMPDKLYFLFWLHY